MFSSNKIYGVLVLLALGMACKDTDKGGTPPERKLPEFMKFTGGAEGMGEDKEIHCACDLNLEIPDFEIRGDDQVFTGFLGGEIERAVTDSSGAGFSFVPFLFGEINLTVKANDSVYLDWPGNLNTGIPFYDEISLFRGRLLGSGTVSGIWMCAPLDIEQGGYVDTLGSAEGTWMLEPFE